MYLKHVYLPLCQIGIHTSCSFRLLANISALCAALCNPCICLGLWVALPPSMLKAHRTDAFLCPSEFSDVYGGFG